MGASDLVTHLQSRYGGTCDDLKSGQVIKAEATVRHPVRREGTQRGTQETGQVAGHEVAKEVATARTKTGNPSQPESLKKPETAASGLPPKTGEQVLCWRSALFVSKGVPQQQADMMAACLLERDRDMDTRRSCAECQQFTRGRCALRKQPFGGGGIEVLHRCSGFKLSEVSA